MQFKRPYFIRPFLFDCPIESYNVEASLTLSLKRKSWPQRDHFRASERLNLPVLFVANKNQRKHTADLVESIVVADGPDIADDYIIEYAAPDDLLVTADVPLAATIVANGGIAIDPRGELYKEENVGEILATRNLMM